MATLNAQTDIVVGNKASAPFLRFLQALQNTAEGKASPADIAALSAQVAQIQSQVGSIAYPKLQVAPPLISNGLLQNGLAQLGVMIANSIIVNDEALQLDGDTAVPGNTYLYSTGTTGVKGWNPLGGMVAGTAGNITATVNADGTVTFNLATVTDAGGGTLQKTAFDAYGRKTGTSAATTTDLAEGTNLYYTDTRADARISLQKAQPSGLATLDAGGKLDAGQLPALAITETFVVNSQAAMLALTAQQGDVCVRTDLNDSFILTTNDPTTLVNWQELETPVDGVVNFNGRTGSVVPATGDYTPEQVGAEPTITGGTPAQYWRGDKSWRDFATDVRAAILNGLSTATSSVITAADTVLSALGKLQAQIGLKMNDTSVSAMAASNAAQSVPSGVNQKILLASEIFDSGFYDPTTSKFTPSVAGKYMCVGTVAFAASVASGNRIVVFVAKNGVLPNLMAAATQNQATNSVQLSCVYDMNGSTDYLELYARQDTGAPINTTNTQSTSLLVYRIGA